MNPAIWFCIFLPVIIVLAQQANDKKAAVIRKILRGKERRISMLEMVEKFIGKECMIYTINSGTQIAGVIRGVRDNWVEIESKGNLEAVNADYIIRVREYPKTKGGKKKSVVLD